MGALDASQGMTRNSVRALLRIALRRWYWPVVFAVVVALALTLFAWYRNHTTYKVSTTLIPARYETDQSGNATSDGFGDVVYRSVIFSQLVTNDQVLDAVSKSVDFNVSASDLSSAITTGFSENSAAVTVGITWDDKAQAQQILDALKANLTYTIAHTVSAGMVNWVDGYSSVIEQPSSSPIQLLLIFLGGALIGLFLGTGYSLFLGMADKRIFNIGEVYYGSDVDVIGAVGRDRAFSGKSYANRNELNKSHNHLMSIGFFFKKQMEDRGKKLIMCIAPTGKCGTSKVTREIARVLSNIKMKVLIVTVSANNPDEDDTPADDPVIVSLFPGVDGCECVWDDSENKSDFIGPISKTLSAAMNSYDFILVDCPALLENIEMAVFAAGMDATMLVAKYGQTTYDEVVSAVSLLNRADAKPIWCVWNFVHERYLKKPFFLESGQYLSREVHDV